MVGVCAKRGCWEMGDGRTELPLLKEFLFINLQKSEIREDGSGPSGLSTLLHLKLTGAKQ